jgi:acyl carrier protein
VAQQVVKVLALDSTNVPDRDDDFRTYGMDSLMAMDLRNRLQAGLSRSLSATIALEHSTIGTLAAFLAEPGPMATPSAPAADSRKGDTPAGPPVPGARLGRDATGKEAWFVPDPERPGKYLKVTTP